FGGGAVSWMGETTARRMALWGVASSVLTRRPPVPPPPKASSEISSPVFPRKALRIVPAPRPARYSALILRSEPRRALAPWGASRRMRAAAALAASCFETHRGAPVLAKSNVHARAAMLLSMRPGPPHGA